MISVDLNRPISVARPLGNYKSIPVHKDGALHREPLVPLGLFTGNSAARVFTDSIYFGQRATSPYDTGKQKGALLTVFVRETVAKRLNMASRLLPDRHALLVLDAYRTPEVQLSLYTPFYTELTQPPFNYPPQKAEKETQNYVSYPAPEHAPHMTGGAVDLVIVQFDPRAWKRLLEIEKGMTLLGHDASMWKDVYALEMERETLVRDGARFMDFGLAFDKVAKDAVGEIVTATRYYEEQLAAGGEALKG